jgi:hypothetical protein
VVSTRIDWVREHCRLLRTIAAEFARTRPFAGLTIGTGIHLEAKTAANFRAARARVSVVDVDPVARLRAHLDGFATPPRDAAIASADLIITVTGARDVLPGGGGLPQRRRRQLRRPCSPAHRRGGRPRLPGPEVPAGGMKQGGGAGPRGQVNVPGKLLASGGRPAHTW